MDVLEKKPISIWFFAFGYFACYVPFSFLTKAISKGFFADTQKTISGFSLLPVSVLSSFICMVIFLYFSGLWRYASKWSLGNMSLPRPTIWTFLSGLLTSLIIVTTTLSYTFNGVSIVFVMLLMRGGVLCIAPLVDAISNRKVSWFSIVGLILSLLALVVAFSEKGGYVITLLCALNVLVYIFSYFARLRFMSKIAKSSKQGDNFKFFVEEQLVATPILIILLFLIAIFSSGDLALKLHYGFFNIWGHESFYLVILTGVFSQGVGIFGGLILLNKSENTFCVPVNRCSSIMAGLVASLSLAIVFNQPLPSVYKIIAAAIIIVAILFLTIPTLFKPRELKAAAQIKHPA